MTAADDATKTKLEVSQEYASLVPQLSAEEYESLKQSIKENGLYVPIIVNQDGIILDGHHRYKVCQELGIKEPKTLVKEFKEELDEQLFVIDCNLRRRQLNNFQRTELALKSKSILTEIAKKNMSLGGKGSKDLEALSLGEKGVAEEIGKIAGVSHETVRKADKLLDSAPEDVIEKLRTGEISISQAFAEYGRGNRRFADYIHKRRDIMRLWIPNLAEMFVVGRNEKHSDDEIKDRIRGFEIDAEMDAKGERYDDIVKDIVKGVTKSMLDTAIEEAKKLADRIEDVDYYFKIFAKMEKEGKDLAEGKDKVQGIGFRHDWQMLIVEREDKVRDQKEEGLVHTFKMKKALLCDVYVTTDGHAFLKLYDTNADLEEGGEEEYIPKLPSTDDYVHGELYSFMHVIDDKKEDNLLIDALGGLDVDYYRNMGMYITEPDSQDPETHYIIGVSDKPTHPEIVYFKNLYESPLCIKDKESYSTGVHTYI
jgi:disulfide oxidoreductase YuzD